MRTIQYYLKVLAIISVFLFPVFTANGMVTSGVSEDELSSYRVTGFMQQQFINNEDDDIPAAFSIHRARVGLAGSVTDRISVNLVAGAVEPPANNPQLVNAFVDFNAHPSLQIRTGQFLVPFGLEGPEPIFLNPAIERSIAIRRMNTQRMFRDVGIQVSGSSGAVSYAAAVINGAGANVVEDLDAKEILGRIGVRPADNLEIGFSGHFGHHTPAGLDDEENRIRAGVDAEWENEMLHLRGEYQFRQDEQPGDEEIQQHGFYMLGAYTLTENWQPVARFEYHDRNLDTDDVYFTGITAGVNYYFQGNNRLSANYEIRNDEADADVANLFTIQMQIAL